LISIQAVSWPSHYNNMILLGKAFTQHCNISFPLLRLEIYSRCHSHRQIISSHRRETFVIRSLMKRMNWTRVDKSCPTVRPFGCYIECTIWTATQLLSFFGTKMNSEACPSPCNRLSQPTPPPPVTLQSRSPLLLGRWSRHLRKRCAGANMVYSRAECVFILEYYFASKSFAAVHESFSNAYPDKEVPNKTTIHRLVTKSRDTLNAERYQNLLTQFIYLLQENERDCWCQHDGAMAHIANTTSVLLP
jgi:hypothetical protein